MIRAYRIPERKPFFRFLNVTTKLIILNFFVFIASLITIGFFGEEVFINNFALSPFGILQGKAIWTIVTSMFSHVLFFHLFANMFSLFFVGNFLERIIGGRRFLLIYFISGLLGATFFVASGILFNNGSPGLGASGAVFGILGVLAVLVPYSRIYLIAGPLILILAQFGLGPFLPMSLYNIFSIIVNVLIFVMIFSILSFNPKMRKFAVPVEMPMWLLPFVAIIPLVVVDFFIDLPIGNSAHIGGLAAGLLYGFYLRRKFPSKTKRISQHFSR